MLKIFQVDEYQTVVAESVEEAKEFYINELDGEEDSFDGDEVNPDKKTMWVALTDLPTQYHVPPYKEWEGDLCAKVSLRVAMEVFRERKAPYILSVSAALL